MRIEELMSLLKNFLFWLKLFNKVDLYCGLFTFKTWLLDIRFDLGKKL